MDDEAWTFDAAGAVAAHGGPCLAYAAFFSDVDHEVDVVRAGYRIAVTYNLYFGDARPKAPPSENSVRLRDELSALLADDTFLPDGGTLGFGLRHAYPLEKRPGRVNRLSYLKTCLKGTDADVLAACEALSQKTSLWMLYRSRRGYGSVLMPKVPNLEGAWLEDDDDIDEYLEARGAARIPHVRVIEDIDDPAKSKTKDLKAEIENDGESSPWLAQSQKDKGRRIPNLVWVTYPTTLNVLRNAMIAYGNQADFCHTYGYVVLLAQVGKAGKRATIRVARSETAVQPKRQQGLAAESGAQQDQV